MQKLFSLAAQNKISSRNLFFTTHAREKFLLAFAQIQNPKRIPKNARKKNFWRIKKT
jgi:hypothetical protein